MSTTYISAIIQFLIIMGVLNQEEAQTVSDGMVAILALITLLMTLWGRYRLGGIRATGFRK